MRPTPLRIGRLSEKGILFRISAKLGRSIFGSSGPFFLRTGIGNEFLSPRSEFESPWSILGVRNTPRSDDNRKDSLG